MTSCEPEEIGKCHVPSSAWIYSRPARDAPVDESRTSPATCTRVAPTDELWGKGAIAIKTIATSAFRSSGIKHVTAIKNQGSSRYSSEVGNLCRVFPVCSEPLHLIILPKNSTFAI